MAQRLTEAEIEAVARRIVADLDGTPGAPGGRGAAAIAASGGSGPAAAGMGIYPSVDEAVKAAREAQPKYVALPLEKRARIIAAIRVSMRENGSALGEGRADETGLGRYEDKIVKNHARHREDAGARRPLPRRGHRATTA